MATSNEEGMESDPLVLQVASLLDGFVSRAAELIEKQKQQREASKKENELESQLAQELTVQRGLSARLAEAARRAAALDAAGARLRPPHVAARDSQRLNHAKDMYQLAKELTGVRLDFSAGAGHVKGFVKSSSRKVLAPFNVTAGAAAERALWTAAAAGAAPPAPGH